MATPDGFAGAGPVSGCQRVWLCARCNPGGCPRHLRHGHRQPVPTVGRPGRARPGPGCRQGWGHHRADGLRPVRAGDAELSESLDPEQFFQVNRNTIASIKAINKFSGYFNRRLILQLLPENNEVIVSRERVQGFKEWLSK